MSIETTRPRALGFLVVLATIVAGGWLQVLGAEQMNDEVSLKHRFEYLSQHGNVECSVQF
jgi:hypothetical protein